MSKKQNLADLRVLFEHDGVLYRSFGVSARRTGKTRTDGFELYVYKHHDLMAGRNSHHASGMSIHRIELVGREERKQRTRIADIGEVKRIDGSGLGSSFRDGVPAFPRTAPSSRQDHTRRSVTLPVLEYPHGYDVFVVPQPAQSNLERLAVTPPYPRSEVAAILAADWLSPAIAILVWVATDRNPYSVTEMHHWPTGSVKLAMRPAAYSGTWINPNASSEDVLIHGPYRGPWPESYDLESDGDFTSDSAERD